MVCLGFQDLLLTVGSGVYRWARLKSMHRSQDRVVVNSVGIMIAIDLIGTSLALLDHVEERVERCESLVPWIVAPVNPGAACLRSVSHRRSQ